MPLATLGLMKKVCWICGKSEMTMKNEQRTVAIQALALLRSSLLLMDLRELSEWERPPATEIAKDCYNARS